MTAEPVVQAATVVSNLSIGSLIAGADPIVKTVIFLLLLASFWSWAIIFDRWRLYRFTIFRMAKFDRVYRAGKNWEMLYDKLRSRPDNPMASMFISGMNELIAGLSSSTRRASSDYREIVKEKIFHSVKNTQNNSIESMEKGLTFLATVGSSAPFIGLFGTVWGIMNSFQSIAASKNTTLAVVAPGIAEALFATAIGLVAAIPAVIFYNHYSSKIRKMSAKLEDFCLELSSILSHKLEENYGSNEQK